MSAGGDRIATLLGRLRAAAPSAMTVEVASTGGGNEWLIVQWPGTGEHGRGRAIVATDGDGSIPEAHERWVASYAPTEDLLVHSEYERTLEDVPDDELVALVAEIETLAPDATPAVAELVAALRDLLPYVESCIEQRNNDDPAWKDAERIRGLLAREARP